jgi:hypothetical protein
MEVGGDTTIQATNPNERYFALVIRIIRNGIKLDNRSIAEMGMWDEMFRIKEILTFITRL